METSDLISLLIAAYKDKVERDSLEKIKVELKSLIIADAEARRATAASDIREMAQLRIALNRFELTYSRIRENSGEIEAVNDYIAQIQRRIKEISFKKNH